MKLEGAVSVVTGAGSGLGAALIHQLADAGVVPVVIDLRPERVQETVDAMKARGLGDRAETRCVAGSGRSPSSVEARPVSLQGAAPYRRVCEERPAVHGLGQDQEVRAERDLGAPRST